VLVGGWRQRLHN